MEIDQIPHAPAKSLLVRRSVTFDLAPGTVGVEEDEEVDDFVAAVLAIVAFELAGLGGDRFSRPRR